jgi:hypothetical protein
MRIRLDEPTLAEELLRVLTERANCIVACVGYGELEAVLIGSYRDAGREELERVIGTWDHRRRTKASFRVLC